VLKFLTIGAVLRDGFVVVMGYKPAPLAKEL